MINTSMVTKDRLEFDPIIPEDERRFYQKAYPNVNCVRERKVHCTVCKMHIGTAPSNESIIRMHPILRVTHCKKCHEFYNSGEFSKGEDGSELYCRWCGQGGEVYCCSNCPFVFCKSCIISNLSRGVVADIEQNENWSCFNCAPKMLWPLRAQHWALIKFIDKQKKAILNSNLSDSEIKTQMIKDRSLCCKIKKTSGYGTDSSDSSDVSLSRLKHKVGEKRVRKSMSKEDTSNIASPALAKKQKTNDEVVCTPDVMSMLEPECQLTVAPNAKTSTQPVASSPKIMSIPQPPKRVSPPPLVVRNAQISQVRPQVTSPIVKKTIIGPRCPTGSGPDFNTPVYHTINGYRIDLNSAAQQETVRLPNGKLIQVKRQGSGPQTVTTVQSATPQPATTTRVIHNAVSSTSVSPIASVPNQQIVHSSGGHIIRAQLQSPRSITVQNPSIIPQFQQQTPQQFQQITIRQPNQQIATIRYQGAPNQQMTNILQNGAVQLLNGAAVATTTGTQVATLRQVPTFVKQFFPSTPLGLSRNQLQNQIFVAMEICQHLMGKVQTLTNSNAYKTAKSLIDVKELYIHLSYLLTYAIGRFKGLQDNCLSDMRDLGFTTDANSLENGQLAADKQASDAEEDEITIVEPKTDTITLDSDNEDELPTAIQQNATTQQSIIANRTNLKVDSTKTQAGSQAISPLVTPTARTNAQNEVTAEYDFSNVANLLANMLEVELTEGGNGSGHVPKKPRKKTTNKPNPTLVKQKEMQERERLENIKKNDAKLKMQVQIPLNKVEEIYEYAKPLVEELKSDKNNPKSDSKSTEIQFVNVEKTDIEVKKQDEEEGDKKIIENEDKEEKGDLAGKKMEEKDESDEVVVVVVEDLDNSKEEPKNEVEENEESVEVIDEDESQGNENEVDMIQSECSASETKVDEKEELENGESKREDELKDPGETDTKELDSQTESDVLNIDEDNETEEVGDEESEVLMELDNNTSETSESAQENAKSKLEPTCVETDPLEEDKTTLLVPMEIETVTENIEKDIENSLDNSTSSHNNHFERIMGRTEVA